jgi:hypothetical protein
MPAEKKENLNETAPFFESDVSGKVTHVRGTPLPDGLIHTVTGTSLSERSPARDTSWVIRGAYKFARRVRGESD